VIHQPARLELRHYGAAPGSHAHDHYQLLWGWRGALELEIGGRGHLVTAGRAAVIAPGERHDFEAPRGSACFVIDVAGVEAGLELLAGRTFAAAPRVLAALAGGQRIDGDAAAMLLASLPAQAPRDAGRRIDWATLDAWIDARLSAPITVAALAAQAFLSPSQFAARCADETGRAPMAYVRERRLALARRLRADGWPVHQLAPRCGYRSPSALTAALKRGR
jgi:AraC-like DNA-binding protein